MKKVVGLWIDHRKAVIVTMIGEQQQIVLTMRSNVEPHVRFAGGSRSSAAGHVREVTPEDQRDRLFTGHLNIYYDAVIAQIHDAEEIFVFGPGEAKLELEKRLSSKGLEKRVLGVQTSDKLTDRQIAAKVKKAFLR